MSLIGLITFVCPGEELLESDFTGGSISAGTDLAVSAVGVSTSGMIDSVFSAALAGSAGAGVTGSAGAAGSATSAVSATSACAGAVARSPRTSLAACATSSRVT